MDTTVLSPDLLRLQIDPLDGEMQRACAAITRASLPPTWLHALGVVLYIAIAAAAYVFTPDTATRTIPIGLGAVVLTVLMLQWDTRRRFRHIQQRDPHARETHYVELSPDGLRTWCDHIDARYPWAEFTRLLVTKEFYLFVRPSGLGSAVPRRLLDHARDVSLRSRVIEWAPHLVPDLEAAQKKGALAI